MTPEGFIATCPYNPLTERAGAQGHLDDPCAPLGAHDTDTGTIEKLIRPLVAEPLAAEWEAVKAEGQPGLHHPDLSRASRRHPCVAWHGDDETASLQCSAFSAVSPIP